MGYGITEKDIHEAIEEEEARRKVKTDKAVSDITELDDDEVEDVAGGTFPVPWGCGFPQFIKLVRNLIVNYAGSTSAKDPVWKYKWVENHEPDVFRKINKWLDIGDYLTFLCS